MKMTTRADAMPHDAKARQQPHVELTDVSVDFGSQSGGDTGPKHVLSHATLAVRSGEFVVLVGRSGCGKTTILNLIAGLLQPASGQVTVGGTSPHKAANDISYMFARDALLPWRTAQKNVELLLELRGVPASKRAEKAARLLDLLGLTEARDRYPWQLSQGMRQRVALARTWALEPRLILMDEPFAALDAQTRVSVQREFLDTWQAKRPTVIFVTHDISEALLLADRVLVVNEGQITEDYTVPFERPRDLTELLGDPVFNDLRIKVNNALH